MAVSDDARHKSSINIPLFEILWPLYGHKEKHFARGMAQHVIIS